MTEGQEIAVRAIIEAWTKEGRDPQTHKDAKTWLLFNWPSLARAVGDLILAE